MHRSLYSHLYRKPIFLDEFVSWVPVMESASAALALLAIGVWVFRRVQGTVLKEI